jgi:hypothetical protein
MTTVKQFEDKKQEIIDTIEILSGEDTDMAIQYAQHQIELLQPPRPTCASCNYFHSRPILHHITSEEIDLDECEKGIIDYKWDFGCVHHSYFEASND